MLEARDDMHGRTLLSMACGGDLLWTHAARLDLAAELLSNGADIETHALVTLPSVQRLESTPQPGETALDLHAALRVFEVRMKSKRSQMKSLK